MFACQFFHKFIWLSLVLTSVYLFRLFLLSSCVALLILFWSVHFISFIFFICMCAFVNYSIVCSSVYSFLCVFPSVWSFVHFLTCEVVPKWSFFSSVMDMTNNVEHRNWFNSLQQITIRPILHNFKSWIQHWWAGVMVILTYMSVNYNRAERKEKKKLEEKP